MPMTINVNDANDLELGRLTPHQVYLGVNDFSIILDDFAKGKIPCNTQQTFPVVFRDDVQAPNKSNQGNYWA